MKKRPLMWPFLLGGEVLRAESRREMMQSASVGGLLPSPAGGRGEQNPPQAASRTFAGVGAAAGPIVASGELAGGWITGAVPRERPELR